MGRMVRKQIVIQAEQERALEDRAAALGVSQSALVREAHRCVPRRSRHDARKQRVWEELRAGMNDSARLSSAAGGSGGHARTFMSAEVLLDTNVLVYAFDADEPEKQRMAQELSDGSVAEARRV